MDSKLIAVSLDGKIDDFYDLTQECPNILEEVDQMLVDNPMHLAAINGYTDFAVEMMRLKPSFAMRLNPAGFSPLQLALQNAHIQTVLRLLAIDKDIVRVQGREGMSPLHYVAKHGNNELLSVFLSTNPTALEDVTIHNQTALHIALENDHVDCVETILKCYKRYPQTRWEKKHLNWKDKNGNTPLHIATARKQTQVVRALIGRQVDVNAINLAGLTALAISEQPGELGSEEINSLLRGAGASSAVLPPRVNYTIEPSISVDKRLKDAAENGDIDMLYTLIREDPYLLDRIDSIPFVDTPLHIAASVGHTGFAREIMLLKPSFARKLNQDGFTPLHLALLEGHTKMVNGLLVSDGDLVRVHGIKGKTPLHYAAEQGKIHLLKQFLLACPLCAQDVTNQSETALHIAVKSRRFDAFCMLVEQLRTDMYKGSQIREYMILNWRNDLGDTVLHTAVKTHQVKVVRVLIDNQVKLNIKNSDNLTAWEISELSDSEVNNSEAREVIKEMLRRAGASKPSSFFWWKSSKSSSPPTNSNNSLTNVTVHLNTAEVASNASPPPTSTTPSALNHELNIALEGPPQGNNVEADNLPPPPTLNLLERCVIDITRGRNNLTDESRNMMLVVLVLFAGLSYQTVLSPPGGVWQGDTNNSTATDDNKSSSQIHHPGTAVMGNWGFLMLMTLNSLVVGLMTESILLLAMLAEPTWLTIICTLLTLTTPVCYFLSLITILPNDSVFGLAMVTLMAVFVYVPITFYRIYQNLLYRFWNLKNPNATHGPAT